MVLMRSCTSSRPSATIFLGLSAALNSPRVALLTPASVACADSTTATSRVYGLTYSSSPLGSGLSVAKRRKISATRSGDGLARRRPLARLALALGGAGPGRTALGIRRSCARCVASPPAWADDTVCHPRACPEDPAIHE